MRPTMPHTSTTRAVIYARYSSDHQREASIDDQVRLCQARADQEGWRVTEVYGDRAISGASLLRPGYQAVMEHARKGEVDVILAESLDRLSRDQEETAALFKRLRFFGVELITVSEGPITELHVGLKGTMNALYLKDLAQKTHRGLEGRVRAGRSGGGLCYGYTVVDERDPSGERVRGGRVIDEHEAAIVRRICRDFRDGKSPRAIAHALNAEGIPGPAGNAWGPSTIYGNWKRGTGILNNELYIGRIVWNRQRYVKDPTTGKRVSQPNAASAVVVQEVPDLRILDDALWQAVKDRQQEIRHDVAGDSTDSSAGDRMPEHRMPDQRMPGHPRALHPERARRPAYLLSGLLKCGACGGGYSKISQTHYGCSRARNQGTCSNTLTIRRDILEERVLEGLRHNLMQPDAVKLFVEEFNAELNRLWATRTAGRSAQERDLARVQKDLDRAVDAVLAGLRSTEIQDRLTALEARKADLQASLATPAEPMPALHPGIADVYARKVADLSASLNDPAFRQEASRALRALIEEVRLLPDNGALAVELYGELGSLLSLCGSGSGSGVRTQERPRGGAGGALQITLVAGVGFEPTTFRL